MENYLLPILEEGGPLGALVVILVLVTGFALRQQGWFAPTKGKAASGSQIADLATQVGAIDKRLNQVEREVQELPTREEIHKLQITQERLNGRMDLLDQTTSATKAGVLRIEDFLIGYSKEKKH